MATALGPAASHGAASRWPHRLAVLLAVATFPLLFVGGLVTSKGAALAVPDWPTTFGHNMFFYPWSRMVGGVFYEHSHRLVASMVGLLTIFLAISLWIKERRTWLRWLGAGALLLVIVQGVLGGLRVILLEHWLAILHACLAQAFFALTVSLAAFTSSRWTRPTTEASLIDGGKLRRLCTLTTALIYVQVISGAWLRHTGERVDAHLLFAAIVALHILFIVLRVRNLSSERATFSRPAALLGVLLLLQLTLGLASYLGKYTSGVHLPSTALVAITTTHLVTGALMLATSLLMTLRSFHLSAAAGSAVRRHVLKEQFSL